ncbi:MAG: tRNA pseudouridine(13) synthase TruD [Proteobacteria bacterium]|nr:tRNA pseudouridine(13) synthase TruD [Pseudomonadota bacterium]
MFKRAEHHDSEILPLHQLNYANGPPQACAVIKAQFTDFCVDEDLGFAFTGEGEHFCIRVKKIDLTTNDVARRISSATGTKLSAIGYSGLKDKRGECTQWFSVHLAADEEGKVRDIENEFLQILESQRNNRKLKIGSHKSNHFKIRLRDCIGSQSEFEEKLRLIQRDGVPNYFGPQRFGKQMSNMTQVLELMRRQRQTADNESISNKERRRQQRSMLYSAARSYLFNQLLSTRLADKNWNRYIEGDVLNLNATNRCFVLQDDQNWDQVLQQRLETFDIHITGALAGLIDAKDKYVSRRQAADIEEAVFAHFGTMLDDLKQLGLHASRRALRFVPANLRWSWATDRDLLLEFKLSKGTYATSFLRELCNTN